MKYSKIIDSNENNIENENDELIIKDSEDFKLSESKFNFEITVMAIVIR